MSLLTSDGKVLFDESGKLLTGEINPEVEQIKDIVKEYIEENPISYDDTEIRESLQKKAEIVKLWTDGGDIYRSETAWEENDNPLTFTEIYELCYDVNNYVYIGDGSNKYYPTLDLDVPSKPTEAIEFISTYQIQGRNTTKRIIINENNEVLSNDIGDVPMPLSGHPAVGQVPRVKSYDDENNVFEMEWGDASSGGSGTDISLGITNASVGQYVLVKAVDAFGKPTEWEVSSIRYRINITASTKDGIPVTGQTITVRKGKTADAPIFAEIPYENAPVSVNVIEGFEYYISISNNLPSHFNPTIATGIVANADINVLLEYSDFSNIKTAGDIKGALESGLDLTELVGETIHSNNETIGWDVVDYDKDNNSVTLLASQSLMDANFEVAQALAYFENGLPIGNYSFKNGTTTYYFTTTKAIPEGGQLRATPSTFTTHTSQESLSNLESGTVSTTEIPDATSIGSCGVELNDWNRANYGSNNYAESAIHQWLNSTIDADTPVPRINKFSRAQSFSKKGLMAMLDEDFLNAIAETEWGCYTNNSYEAPSSLGLGIPKGKQNYTVTSKFALASEQEIFNNGSGFAGEQAFDLFKSATNEDRKKTDITTSSSRGWWLRSPYVHHSYYVRLVSLSGIVHDNAAFYSYGVVPVCKIVGIV